MIRHALIAVVKAYRLLLSPHLGNACRFAPTCSVYAIEALQTHGSIKGSGFAAWRILRCGPWCEGGHDPVPPRAATAFQRALFSRLLHSPDADSSAAHTPTP